ncbi:MAG: MBL fold metallo-hydrolase [Bdellovibrionota bacterium]
MINIKNIDVTCISQHARILWDESTKEAVIVDPGGSDNRVISFLKENGLKLKSIVLTHSHFDHCGGVCFLKEHFKSVPLYGHKLEKKLRENVQEMMKAVGVLDETCKNAPEPDIYFEDNQEIYLGEEKFIVLFTPGHSPGSVSLYNKNNKILLSGDTLFAGSIGRTDFIGGDFKTIIKSIKERLFTLPEDTVVYPGHGENTTIGYEKKFNSFFN